MWREVADPSDRASPKDQLRRRFDSIGKQNRRGLGANENKGRPHHTGEEINPRREAASGEDGGVDGSRDCLLEK
jgi:hypothetical protein